MKKLLVLGTTCLGLLVLGGCAAENETGDVAAAQKAARSAPKTAEELPSDMPPQAKSAATSAMGQAQAAQQMGNDPARVRAMQEMQKQKR